VPTTASASPDASLQAVQQSKTVSGVITDDMGPVIGASILEKGTTNGTVTDLDGRFSLNVKPGATLVVSYLGYKTQEISVGNQSSINITMQSETTDLDEVVVVGYGVQKKKLVTGATVQVKGDDIAKLNTTSVLTAMQSQTPGVQIVQQSGQAGDGFKVNIRGLGTMGGATPLYVIDGVAGGDINTVSPNDIESIDVLKDAASAAIYGARAANGVILITTKQGKAGKIQVSYDGYVGWQYLAKHPDVLNAKEWMYARDLLSFNTGGSGYDWASMIPTDTYNAIMDGTWKGTDWVDESYHKGALTQGHSFNIVGGSEMSKFSLGFAYTQQDGIFGGNNQSKYDRYNVRINSDHVIYKKDDLEIIKVGENMTFNQVNKGGVALGNLYWNSMHDLLVGNPLIPAYNEDGTYFTNADYSEAGYNLGASPSNPLILTDTQGMGLNKSRSWNLALSGYLMIQPIKDLIFKSQLGYRHGTSTYRSMTRLRNTGTSVSTQTAASQNMSTWSTISWENTLSYKFNIEKHTIEALIGNTIEKNSAGEYIEGSGKNLIFGDDWERAYLSNTKNKLLSDVSVGGYPSADNSLASFFGRINYNYDEKYMFQFTLRADGSSNFAKGKRWGWFPSASVGWVVTNEPFMEQTKSWLDFLKLRASWGQNGNCNIPNFQYLTSFTFDDASGYYFGAGNHSSQTTGGYADVLINPDVTWETSEQLDLGFDARFLGSRLGVAFDWYNKKTKDWLLAAPILSVYGLNAPYINGGDVKNTGIELGLDWHDHIGDFTYGINYNLAYNKNKVTKINNTEGIIHGPENILMQGSQEVYRAQVGEPIGYFYGMKTAGVFQNQEEIDNWLTKYTDNIHGTLEPGDLIYVDTNGDGIIDSDDRCNIGNPHPDVTMGLGINFGYKGFDFSMTAAGAFGQQILKVTNNGTSAVENYNKRFIYESWKGEGTSNTIPKINSMGDINFMTMSDMWLEDADYVKMQNITLGYDFKHLYPQMPLTQCRVYFTMQNLFTITGYSGMDPEVGSTGGNDNDYSWGAGIDNGFYPNPRTFMIGVNLKF